MDGFAFAGESLCGNFIGAGQKDMLHRCIASLFKWGALMALLFSIIYVVGGNFLMGLMTADDVIVENSKEYFYWVIAIPFAGFASFTWDGIFIGATQTRAMLVSMATSTMVYFLIYFMLFDQLGNHGLWVAFIAYLLTRGVILSLLRKRISINNYK